jgi:hypothetical protein
MGHRLPFLFRVLIVAHGSSVRSTVLGFCVDNVLCLREIALAVNKASDRTAKSGGPFLHDVRRCFVSQGMLPTYKEKHQLLFAKERNTALLSELGRKLVRAGWLCDAIDFFSAAKDLGALQEVRRTVIEEGDIFLLRRCLIELKESGSEEEWKQIGERAMALGKLQFARESFRMSGDKKAMDAVNELIQPSVPEPTPVSNPVSNEE